MAMALPTSTRCAAALAMACFCARWSRDFAVKPGSSLLRVPPSAQGAAVDALEQTVGRQALDVAADRHVGHAEALDEVGDLDGARLLDELEDDGPALAGEHRQSSLSTATPPGARRTVPSTGASATRSYPLAATVCSASVWLSRKSHDPDAAAAAGRLDAAGEVGDGGLDAGGVEHVVEQRTEGRVVRERAEVPGGSGAVVAGATCDRGAAGEGARRHTSSARPCRPGR